MTNPQDPSAPTPAARRQRRSRIAAVGASLGAAVVLTGGLALANQGTASGGASTGARSNGGTRAATQVAPTTPGDGGYRDPYGDDPYGDDGSFVDDGGGQWRQSSPGPQVQSPSADQQPSTSSGGS